MKQLVKVVLIMCTVLSVTTAFAQHHASSDTHGDTKPINRIIAVVNQDIITESDLDNAVSAAKQQMQHQHITSPKDKILRAKILDGLILQKLQLQVAKQNKITIPESEVNTTIEKIAQQNQVSVAQLKSQLAKQNITMDDFKQQIQEQLIIRNLQQQAIVSSIKITKNDIQAYKEKRQAQNEINDYAVMDYLIPLPAHPTPAAKNAARLKAEQLAAQLKKHGKHAKIDATIEKNKMGSKPLSDYPDLFSVPLAHMAKGSVSTPILAGNGYHVLHLLDVSKEKAPIDDQQAQQAVFQEKFQQKLTTWLKKLRKQAYVKIYLNP